MFFILEELIVHFVKKCFLIFVNMLIIRRKKYIIIILQLIETIIRHT